MVLRGVDSDGVFLTAKAASYPDELCEIWSGVIDANFHAAVPRSRDSQLKQILEHPVVETTLEGSALVADAGLEGFIGKMHQPKAIPASLVEQADHIVQYAHAWRQAEAIHLLEARASVKALQHACRSPCTRCSRVLILCDNLSAVGMFNKGRCTSYPLLRLARRAAALQLAHGVHGRWRYIPTDRNLADIPTRPDLLKAPFAHGDPIDKNIHFERHPPKGRFSGDQRLRELMLTQGAVSDHPERDLQQRHM